MIKRGPFCKIQIPIQAWISTPPVLTSRGQSASSVLAQTHLQIKPHFLISAPSPLLQPPLEDFGDKRKLHSREKELRKRDKQRDMAKVVVGKRMADSSLHIPVPIREESSKVLAEC
ncbi:hypothetical protein KIL84_008913 [Mauremys mutica]|uniref:Uncharacterized protein n=1 Tax=Mauremys mutica TaxID=74926 RepID=A0A9D3X7H3_9SAUR|nr:hypothetical protein KIL84_008913 [Mauremys mutica]